MDDSATETSLLCLPPLAGPLAVQAERKWAGQWVEPGCPPGTCFLAGIATRPHACAGRWCQDAERGGTS